MTHTANAFQPFFITKNVTLHSGEQIVIRLLRPDDATRLGQYFLGLSEETRRRYGPHPFTMEQAEKLCSEINNRQTMRLIALKGSDEDTAIVAYFILQLGIADGEQRRYAALGITLDNHLDCLLAPSVADAYQNRGLGSIMMPIIRELARRMGRQRMLLMGGVQATNKRAIHFYEKHGFRQVGDFETITKNGETINNHDMILVLTNSANQGSQRSC